MLNETQIDNLVEILKECDSNTKIYFGCDSIRKVSKEKKIARFSTVLVVHKNGNNGAKVFSHISLEPDYDYDESKPITRMMKEVEKVIQLWEQTYELVKDYEVEIHLDINTSPEHGSNCAFHAARGYILGVTGIEPKFKPEALAASFGADWSVKYSDEDMRARNDKYMAKRKRKKK